MLRTSRLRRSAPSRRRGFAPGERNERSTGAGFGGGLHVAVDELEAGTDTIRTRLAALFAREEVKIALLQRGINPAEAEAQILAMTDDEVVQLGGQLADLPAAGDMGMSGGLVVVMVVAMAVLVAALIIFGVWAVNRIDRQR